jgi:hypothetical protein
MSSAVAVLDAVVIPAAAGMVVDVVLDAEAAEVVVDAAGVGDEVQPASVSAATAPHDATTSRCLRRGRPRRCRWSRCNRSGCITPAFRELLNFRPPGAITPERKPRDDARFGLVSSETGAGAVPLACCHTQMHVSAAPGIRPTGLARSSATPEPWVLK